MRNKHFLILIGLLILQNIAKSQTVPAFSHIVVVIGENTSANSVYGNADAPYINSLANAGAKFTNSYAIEHPSQPNYLDLFSGSNQGITNNNTYNTSTKLTSANLGAGLITSGKTFISYSDGLPSVGFDGTSKGNYVRKHNPVANWMGSGTNQIPDNINQPFSAFPANFNNLPDVAFVIPDLCNGGHNSCAPLYNPVKQYDTWIRDNLNAYKEWCVNNNSLLIITFDEDDYSATNKIATVFYGAHLIPNTYTQTINHYSILRMMEDANGLTAHAGAAATATPINFIWLNPLLLKLLNFTINKETIGVSLHWQTTNEINFEGFEVESGIDGKTFNSIGKIKATGLVNNVSNYTYSDINPVEGINYYRLKLIESNGMATYSDIVSVDYTRTSLISVWPNPVHQILKINTDKTIEQVNLINVNGEVVKTWKNVTSSSMLNVASVAAGVYIVQTISGKNKQSYKVIKD